MLLQPKNNQISQNATIEFSNNSSDPPHHHPLLNPPATVPLSLLLQMVQHRPQQLLGPKQELIDPAEQQHNRNTNNQSPLVAGSAAVHPLHPALFAVPNPSSVQSPHVSSNNILLPADDHHHSDPPSAPSASTAGTSSSSSGPLSCTVCGDVATGRHYGSVACNGCKGFFRRTIRRGYKYTCRFSSNCHIDKHNRAVCRACRYARCIQFGMKVDAVQSERDLIGKRSRSYSNASAMTTSPPASAGSVLGGTAEEETREGQQQQQPEPQMVKMEQRQVDNFDLGHSSGSPCSSATISVPPSVHFMAQQQQHYSSQESDEPVPRKRSFSSGSKKQFRVTASNAGPPSSSSNVAEQQQQQAVQQQATAPPQQPMEDPNLMDPWGGRSNGRALLRQLLCSEEKIRNMRETVIAQTCNLEYINKRETPRAQLSDNGARKANENDILQSLHSQLLLVIEWAKTLKPFADLPTEDQTALLKNFAAQHVVLCVAYRSTSDFLKLINDSCIPRVANGDDKDLFYRKDAERVMDLLVSPMRFLRIDDVEFVAMKACILFNPVARGLSPSSVMSVLQTRRQIFRALQQYVQAKMPPDEDRVGDLTFFILSPLQSLAKAVSEDVLVSKLSGVARLDQLMEELILEDNDPKEPETPMDQPSGTEDDQQAGSAMVAQQQQQQQQGQYMEQQQQQTGPPHPLFPVASSPAGWAPLGDSNIRFPPVASLSAVAAQQRSRHLSSSASSSSNSPPLGHLQSGVSASGAPPPMFHPTSSAGPLSPIKESEFSSSALSSYVFGAFLQSSNSAHQHPQHVRPVLLPPPSSSVLSPQQRASVACSSPSSSTQQVLSPQFRPANFDHATSTSTDHPHHRHNQHLQQQQQQHSSTTPTSSSELWAQHNQNQQQIGSHLLYGTTTPSTPAQAIYSGTSPSPPQRFGIGGGINQQQ